MADINLGDGLKKVLLAGIGAVATTVEKSQWLIDDLVKKGELTVEQGKQLNTELKHTYDEHRASERARQEEARAAKNPTSDADPGDGPAPAAV